MTPPAPAARPASAGLAEAAAWHQGGRLEEAERICRSLLLDPGARGPALHRLGLVEMSRHRAEAALHTLQAAARALPDSPAVHNDLGNAFTAAGRHAEALACYLRSVALDPAFAGGFHNVGLALQKLGRYAEAVAGARRATELAPEWAAAHHSLGCALWSAQRPTEGAAAFARATRLAPEAPEFWRDAAASLTELLDFDGALQAIDRAIALAPALRDLRLRRAELLFRRGDYRMAAAAFSAEIAGGAGPPAWNGLARVRLSEGDFAAAADALRSALALEPGQAESLRLQALIGIQPATTEELARLAALADDPAAAPGDRIAAGFALGKKWDDAGRHDEAFARFAAANAAVRARRASAGARFHPAALRAAVDRLVAEPAPSAAWVESEVPVFIVGMPRSGTSLVEQIAASHPAVFGAGELTQVQAFARRRQPPTPEWARAHLARLEALAPGASRVIDKTPDNLFHLGLIARCFALPRVVLCLRDPRDTALSCFFTYFSTGNLWSFDLEDCGVRCAEAGRLARHWTGAPGLRLHVVRYEQLVADPEGESRRLIAFLGLPWDDACLHFDRTVRAVATPSFWQVRQPVYARSVGRWRAYERHLGPLWKGLGGFIEGAMDAG